MGALLERPTIQTSNRKGLEEIRPEEPVFLTKNGEGDLVVMDIETYNRREKMLTLREELLAVEEDRIADRTGCTLDGKKEFVSYIITDWCEMSIQRNKEYNKEKYLQDTDDFLYWKYYLDMESIGTDEDTYIKRIHALINHLKGYCNGVVAACDFENCLTCNVGEEF